jgi:spore coat protein U-like protein
VKKNILIVAALSCGVAALAPASQAGSLSTTFEVRAVVESACTVVTATALDFGSYTASNLAGNPVDSTITVSTTCTDGAGYLVTMDDGLYAAAAGCPLTPSRRMAAVGVLPDGLPGVFPEAPDTRLPYGIYQDSTRTIPVGCNANNGVFMALAGSAQLTFHGRIGAGANVMPATYNDVVTVTINF